MVSKSKIECGLIGFQAPVIPKAPRSIRKRGPRKKEDGNLCPFELLAAVAGQLLEESESSNSSNVAEEKVKPCVGHVGNEDTHPFSSDDKALNSDNLDHRSCAESSFVPETYTEKRNDANLNTDNLEKVDCDTKLGIRDIKNDDGSVFSIIDSERRVYSDNDKYQTGDLAMANKFNVKDPKQEYVNTSNIVLNNSESGVQLPVIRDHWKNVQLGIRDDDDNSFGGNKLSTKVRSSFRSQPRFIHRQIMKRGSSRFRIAAPKMRNRDFYNTNEGMKSFYRYRKNSYARERSHYAPIKKRRLYYHKSGYNQDTSCDSVSHSPTVKVHKKTTDPKVKLKIKSFVVPELYIDMSETDTVGSLKRAVMEAVTSLLGGGIRVGVVLKGRKCRDDNKTLQQTGISESSNLDTLGFMLEPKLTNVSSTRKILKASHSEVVENQSQRSPGTPVIDSGISNASIDTPPAINGGDVNNSNYLVQSPQTPPNTETTDNELSPDSKAIVPVLTMNPEALAMIPVNAKPKRSELSQRRTRRPFSVSEVEALVSAVEKLGTGRWRDVKMGAFENADHRTYVDLKDKWKTLVHTASISPQQRRGEPVPQELLDRVLAAHSYWSQHQSKQHGKNSNIEPMMIENVCEEIAQA